MSKLIGMTYSENSKARFNALLAELECSCVSSYDETYGEYTLSIFTMPNGDRWEYIERCGEPDAIECVYSFR